MKTLQFPYGKEKMSYTFEDSELSAVLTSQIHHYKPGKSGAELVKEALQAPIGTPTLAELAKGKKNIVIIASDHTRPVPSTPI